MNSTECQNCGFVYLGDCPICIEPRERIYLSGPMSNLPDLNHPLFHAVAADLRGKGYRVNNPAETALPQLPVSMNPVDKLSIWIAYMREDIKLLMDSDKVAVLPNWQQSKGAKLEVYLAHELGMEIINAITLEPVTGILRD